MGTTVARYTYDAWGKVLTVTDANGTAIADINHIANINPFRYRSYYYDTETEFYYLQSRYYDPEVGRFINRDSIFSSFNLYSYCDNNCIMYTDSFGYSPHELFLTMDAAAYDFAMNYNSASIRDKREYGSAIYLKCVYRYHYVRCGNSLKKLVKTVKHYYSYTKPNRGSKKSGRTVIPNLFIPFGTILVSTIHSHGNYDKRYKNEVFSDDDIWWANKFKMNIYVVTPGGFLKKYYYKTKKTVVLSYFNIPFDPTSPDKMFTIVPDFYTI